MVALVSAQVFATAIKLAGRRTGGCDSYWTFHFFVRQCVFLNTQVPIFFERVCRKWCFLRDLRIQARITHLQVSEPLTGDADCLIQSRARLLTNALAWWPRIRLTS